MIHKNLKVVKSSSHLSRESLSESQFRVRVDTSKRVRNDGVVQTGLISLKRMNN